MTTPTGHRIGPYVITAPLGVGGMGEVYRAHDSKLGRDVAIKILPHRFTLDAERRARFAREARVLATLNHPHIGAIYGLEESDGISALILELVEGPTLARRLQGGPIPIAEAIAIAGQIAEALDAAHEKGIVHRDLKPGNIILQSVSGPASSDVRAKVLDFGLAKPVDTDEPAGQTRTIDSTGEGRIVGTPAYMSPEQARGLPIDKRTDIWAFGCVLFEMLTGSRSFEGATATDTLARILDHDPDWSLLPPRTPASIRTLLERCLRKDPRKRLRDIADALIEIEATASETAPSTSPVSADTRRWVPWVLTAAATTALVVVTSLYVSGRRPRGAEVVEFPVSPAPNSYFSGTASEFAISPDGRQVAFAASYQGVSMIWVRSVSSNELRMLPGTERGRGPFWKPDSQSLGFFANSQLKTIQINGGSPVTLCRASDTGAAGPAGSWGAQNVIVFGGAGNGALNQIAATSPGTQPKPVTVLLPADTSHRWPEFLPDGNRFLYLAQGGATDELRLGFVSGAPSVSLGPTESHGAYASGYLFFVRGGNLMAQPVDEQTLKRSGEPLTVATETGVNQPWQHGMFSVSASGNLAYNRTARISSELTWLNREGQPTGTAGDPGVYFNMDLSPDEQRIAISKMTERPGTPAQFDIWTIDLTRANASSRLTDDPAWEFDPSWSPDGRVVFNSNRPDPQRSRFRLFVRAADGSGHDEPLPIEGAVSPDWSRDGRFIVYNYVQPGSGPLNTDLMTFDLKGDGKPRPFVTTQYAESNGAFSPNGKWIAYHSTDSGRSEVYVRPFPAGPGVIQISRDGGWGPRWRGDGKEIFFLANDGTMMSVTIDTTKGFVAGVPTQLFSTRLRPGNNRAYAVAKNGQRFLIPQIGSGTPITLVLNWPALLKK